MVRRVHFYRQLTSFRDGYVQASNTKLSSLLANGNICFSYQPLGACPQFRCHTGLIISQVRNYWPIQASNIRRETDRIIKFGHSVIISSSLIWPLLPVLVSYIRITKRMYVCVNAVLTCAIKSHHKQLC